MILSSHTHPFTLRRPMQRLFRVATVLRLAVLAALLLGMTMSTLGSISSHGLAALGHDADGAAGGGHGHSHEDDGATAVTDPVHPHHAHDHSHDKAHALLQGVPVWLQESSAWFATARKRIERAPVFRLDRPPQDHVAT